ncbi:hypothetical protein [Nocardia sp. NPDC052566]|uniref:hypothetical protein n=1 Tax=Nocardia sp. NPDC052566 TaxID=3364330 RepID=UPI0037CCB41C
MGAAKGFRALDDLQRIRVPGIGTVQLTKTGTYSVNYEYTDASHRPPPTTTVLITGPDGVNVSLTPYGGRAFTYATDRRQGRTQFTFQVAHPGAYRVTTEGSPEVTVAIGPGGGLDFVPWLIGGLCVGIGGLLVGVVVLIVVTVGRAGSKRRMMR